MSFGVEVVVNLAVITGELLEHCDGFETLHRTFLSSKGEVQILTSVVGSVAAELLI
jgi:hypothetical protein